MTLSLVKLMKRQEPVQYVLERYIAADPDTLDFAETSQNFRLKVEGRERRVDAQRAFTEQEFCLCRG